MKKLSRLVSLLCVVSLICACLPVTIMAEGEGVNLSTPQMRIPWGDIRVGLNSNFLVAMSSDGNAMASLTGGSSSGTYYASEEFQGEIANTGKIVDIAVPPTGSFVAGLRSNGTVYVTGPVNNSYGQDEVTEWTDIVQIDANDYHVVGLKADGTVVSTTPKTSSYGQDEVTDSTVWKDIVKVVAGKYVTFGLKKDGTVVTTATSEKNNPYKYNHSDVTEWTDIVDICTSDIFTLGLKSDGTVVSTGYGTYTKYAYAVKTWSNAVSISAYSTTSSGYAVGAMSDGTVQITNSKSPFSSTVSNENYDVNAIVSTWENIKKVYAGPNYVIGLKYDGTLVYASNNSTVYNNLSTFMNSDVCLEKVTAPTITYQYEDLGDGMGCYGYLNVPDNYTDLDKYNYKIYYIEEPKKVADDESSVTDLSKNPFNAANLDVNLFTDPIKIERGLTYNVVLAKQDVNDETKIYPSNILKVEVKAEKESLGGFLPEIKAIKYNGDSAVEPTQFINTGVIDPTWGSISFKLAAYFNGEKLDFFDIYYRNVDESTEYSKYDDRILKYDKDVNLSIYAKLDNIVTNTENYSYVFLTKETSKYPKQMYDSALSSEEHDEQEKGFMLPERNIIKVASSGNFSLALNTNGTVDAACNTNVSSDKATLFRKVIRGNEHFKGNTDNSSGIQASVLPASFDDTYDWNCVGNWRMISDVAAGAEHVVGLRLDGTVISSGANGDGQCNTSGWKDIVAVAAGSYHTVGLKKDGTVVATGRNESKQCDVDVWNYTGDDAKEKENAKIVAIAANNMYTLGLRKDGTVRATSGVGYGEASVVGWENIVAIAAGTTVAVGLKNDGTVVVAGDDEDVLSQQTDTWRNIVQVSVGTSYILGLDYNGKLFHACRTVDPEEKYKIEKGAIYYYNTVKKTINSIDNMDYCNGKRENVFEYFENAKIETISAGTCHFVVVVEEEDSVGNKYYVPYTVVHDASFTNSSDKRFPIIATDDLLQGPTFKNSYPSGKYNKDLSITLEDTTSGYEYRYTTDANQNPIIDGGIKYENSFEMTRDVLTVYTKSVSSTDDNNELVMYYYNFNNPDIVATPPEGQQSGPVKVMLTSTIKSYDIYYTTDGTEPPDTTAKLASSTAQPYIGTIELNESTYIRARAYDSSGKSTAVFNLYYSIPTNPIDGSTGTVVDYTNIPNGVTKVWTAKGSPYIVNSSFTVSSGGALNIESGVEIRLAKSASFTVSGSLRAEGTDNKQIRFVAINPTDKWSGITLSPSTQDKDSIYFTNVEVANSTSGISISKDKSMFKTDLDKLYIHDNSYGLSLNNTSAKEFNITNSKFIANDTGLTLKSVSNVIDKCTFDKNVTALSIQANDNTVTNSSILNSKTVGVLNSDASGTVVNDCIITGNVKSVEAKVTGNTAAEYTLNFQNNGWGNVTEGIIRRKITDKSANEKYPKVDITGFKTNASAFVKCEFDSTLCTNNTTTVLTLNNALSSQTVYLTAANVGSAEREPVQFFVAMYDENGALVKVGTARQVLEATASTMVTLTMNDVNSADNVASIKIFAWSGDGKWLPYSEMTTIQ